MKKVLLLLANGYETFEASVFIDVIGWNYIDGDKTTRLYTCGLTKEVKTTFDQKSVVDYIVDEIDVNDYDALAIPGGFSEYDFYKDAYDESFLELIRQFNRQNKVIASICVAALSLAKSGILEGKKATTYNKNDGIRQAELREMGVDVLNQPIVQDGNIITSWNPATAMDVAFLLLDNLTGKENTRFIKTIMGYDS